MKFSYVPISLLLMGCVPATSPEVSRDAGRALFAENCAACHGNDATGNGSVAAGLGTPPADLTKIASRRNGVWPTLEVMSIIDGYAKRNNARDDMPVISGLSEGPMVNFDTGNGVATPTPARLIALAQYLESIQSPPPTRYVP